MTGSNTGVGFETARRLASGGYKVVLACRDVGKAVKAAAVINQELAADTSAAGSAVPMELDLADLHSVRRFQQQFAALGWELHVLVANAGLNGPKDGKTSEGYDLVFGTNYLAHFLLVQLLLPALKETGSVHDPARVVLLSSVMHHLAPGKFASAIPGTPGESDYSDSKLAMSVLAEVSLSPCCCCPRSEELV